MVPCGIDHRFAMSLGGRPSGVARARYINVPHAASALGGPPACAVMCSGERARPAAPSNPVGGAHHQAHGTIRHQPGTINDSQPIAPTCNTSQHHHHLEHTATAGEYNHLHATVLSSSTSSAQQCALLPYYRRTCSLRCLRTQVGVIAPPRLPAGASAPPSPGCCYGRGGHHSAHAS